MRRHLILGLLLTLVVILGSWGLAHAQEKSLYWQRWDVNIDVQQNSDMHIEEVQEIVFTSGTFRFGFRAIPLELEDASDFRRARIDGRRRRGVRRPVGRDVAAAARPGRVRWLRAIGLECHKRPSLDAGSVGYWTVKESSCRDTVTLRVSDFDQVLRRCSALLPATAR